MRSLILLAVAASLVLVPAASAQVPPLPGGPAPVYTLAITNAPTDLAGLAANTSAQVPFSIVLELGNVFCTAAVTIPVTITATAQGAPSNVAFTVEPSVINITIDQGPHAAPPAGAPGGGTGDAMLIGTVTGNITANGTAAITLVADAPAPAGAPQGCQGAGALSAVQSAPVTVNATLAATPQPPPEPTPVEDTPFVGLLAVLGVAGAVALARRRKD